MNNIKKAINIDKELEKLFAKQRELDWIQFTTGLDKGIDKMHDAVSKKLENKKNYEIINELLQTSLSPDDRRRVEILKKVFEPCHLSDELNEIANNIFSLTNKLSGFINTFRYKIDGKEISMVDLNKILSEDNNRTNRKKAYLALAQINKPLVDNGFIDLINLRKEYVKQSGAENCIEFSLKNDELDYDTFDGWKEAASSMADSIKKVRNKYREKYLNISELEPWDSSYLSSKIAPMINRKVDMSEFYEPLQKTFLEFGFDIAKYNLTYDIFPRKNKSEWGLCWFVEQGVDVRILANVKNSYNQFNILLHETGHAVHNFNIDHNDMLSRKFCAIVSEGFANFFGFLHLDQMFYKNIFQSKQYKQVEEQFNDYKKWYKMLQIRSVNLILFEHELYKTEIKTLDDINQLKWKLDKEILGEEPHEGEPLWGYVPHFTDSPLMLHGYLMGDVTIEMMKQVFLKKENIKNISEKPKKFGDFMVNELLKPTGKYTFNEIFKKISGEKFSLKYLDERF